MLKIKLLIAEDDRQLADLLGYALEKEGFNVKVVYDGLSAISIYRSWNPKLLVLDWMMPGLSGVKICKATSDETGVIMLTAKTDIEDRLKGLESGADDYILKPFDIRELIARVHALTKRMKLDDRKNLTWNECELVRESYEIKSEDSIIKLTAREFELFEYLVKHEGMVISRERLLDAVWGLEFEGGTRTVDIHIQRLRKKLSAKFDQDPFITIYGRGYQLRGRV